MAFALRYNWTLSKYTVIDSDSGENVSILPIAAMAALRMAESPEIAAVLQNPPTEIAAVLQNPPTEITAVLQNPSKVIAAVTQASGSHFCRQLWYL